MRRQIGRINHCGTSLLEHVHAAGKEPVKGRVVLEEFPGNANPRAAQAPWVEETCVIWSDFACRSTSGWVLWIDTSHCTQQNCSVMNGASHRTSSVLAGRDRDDS